jgi:hypothetical protein
MGKNTENGIIAKYFVSCYFRPRLNSSYAIDKKDLKKMNKNVDELNKKN